MLPPAVDWLLLPAQVGGGHEVGKVKEWNADLVQMGGIKNMVIWERNLKLMNREKGREGR